METERFFFHGILQGRYKPTDAVLEGNKHFFRGHSTFKKGEEDEFVTGTLEDVPVEDIQLLDMIESKGVYYDRYQRKVRNLSTGELELAWVYQQVEDMNEDGIQADAIIE